jgi:hypothetical protein
MPVLEERSSTHSFALTTNRRMKHRRVSNFLSDPKNVLPVGSLEAIEHTNLTYRTPFSTKKRSSFGASCIRSASATQSKTNLPLFSLHLKQIDSTSFVACIFILLETRRAHPVSQA